MKSNKQTVWGIIIKSALLIIGVIGQTVTVSSMNFMSSAHFKYFTNLSNIWIMAIIAVFLVYDILRLVKGDSAPHPKNWLYTVKFVCTVAITLTFLVFSVLLIPQLIAEGNAAYIFSISNLCVHNIVPMLAILDFCLFDYDFKTSKLTFLWSALLPIAYSAFVIICSYCGVMFGEDKFPYFFFNYDNNGWLSIKDGNLGVAYWILLLAGVVFLIGIGLIAIKNAVAKKRHGS